MEQKENEDAIYFEGCNVEELPCTTCVWAYVYGCKPTLRVCGKFKKKPKSIYFKGNRCPKYEALKNL